MAEKFNILIIGSTFGHKFFQYEGKNIEIEMKSDNLLLFNKEKFNKKTITKKESNINVEKIERVDHNVLQNILELSKNHNNIHVYFVDYTGTDKTYKICINDYTDVTKYTISEGTIHNHYNTNNNKNNNTNNKRIITFYDKKQYFEYFSSQKEYKDTFHCILIDYSVMKFFITLNKFNIFDAIISLLQTGGEAYMRDIYIQKTEKITDKEISTIEDKISKLEDPILIKLNISELEGETKIPIWKDISIRELQILSFIYCKKKLEEDNKNKKLEEDNKNKKLEEDNKNKKISELKDRIEKIFNYIIEEIIYNKTKYYEVSKINEFLEDERFITTFIPNLCIRNFFRSSKLIIYNNFLDKYQDIIDYEIYDNYYPLYFHPYKKKEKENIIKLTKKNIQKGGLKEQTTKALFSNNNELVWDFMKGKEKKRAIFSRLNGSEPDYEPSKWNDNQRIKETHNCYAYALDIIKHHFRKKPQPGYASGYSYLTDEDIRSCDRMFDRIKADNSSVIRVSYRDKCPKGYKKAYLAVDDGEDTDYHFYRMDSSGFWSHKPGSTEAREENSDGSKIIQPHKAKRISTSHNYKKSCGYFCYDPKKINISNKPLNK